MPAKRNIEFVKLSGLTDQIAEGKTKKIWRVKDDPGSAFLIAKSDITAGDGQMHDVIVGKNRLANQTTCNVFSLLKASGVPVAFDYQIILENSKEFSHGFKAPLCKMLKFEVVIRREAHGSYIDRHPYLRTGHHFPRLVLEFFLKTSGKIWTGYKSKTVYNLVKDDPLIELDPEKVVELYYPGYTSQERKSNPPKGALINHEPFLVLPYDEVFENEEEIEHLVEAGKQAGLSFLVIEKAWQLLGRKPLDCKFEFGLDANGKLRLADVVDNDSWRVLDLDGSYMDKQFYRDGGDLNEVTRRYERVTELTSRFEIPRQGLLFWRGSDKDDLESFRKAVNKFLPTEELADLLVLSIVTCSAHKKPIEAYSELQQLVHEIPDSVVISYIGRSNGAGPTLSANASVPHITVPASFEGHPEDVWSSLRTPSEVPVMTILEPANAVHAALNILAARNPAIYARLHLLLEERLSNIMFL